ncbi:MAG: SAF domain-containing protein [Salinisphaera sp.]|uniref:NAD(P)H-dependent oxidoreductase n=1 Tax=Salinisphaera sp. TaxID=1914330 RepID=UPI003C7D5753
MSDSHSLLDDLERREREGRPVTIGLVGTGEMGTDIVTQVSLMPGIRIGVIVELELAAARKAIAVAGLAPDVGRETSDAATVQRIIDDGGIALTSNHRDACTCEAIDVLIDATGSPSFGARLAVDAFAHGKHLVLMNVETDVTIGPLLQRRADEAGVVYTLGAGDEPSATMELVRFVRSLGYPIVAAGKGKNNKFDRYAVPRDYEEEAARRNMNPRMLVEFVDGSKTMIEMAALANATGLVPDVPGMHGVDAGLSELPARLCPREDGGLLSQRGVVDFSVGRGVAPGVFVIVETRHPRIRERLEDLHVGKGWYHLFHRPYHLTSLEVPLSAAEAVLYHKAAMQPLPQRHAEATAVAKRDLAPGETLDAIGGYAYFGNILSAADARKHRAVPLGLCEGARVTQPIKANEYLTYANCTPDADQPIVRLRHEQDELLDPIAN